jgi:two-component system, chemotaxis family, chemotaxis protein CheY
MGTAPRGPILVVEDDRAIRETITDILQCEGYAVEAASNGLLALERLRAGSQPALLIVDLLMPVLGGWDLCRALGREPRWAGLPVVIVSADAIARPLPLPQAQVLAKPIRFDRLLAEVERVCG